MPTKKGMPIDTLTADINNVLKDIQAGRVVNGVSAEDLTAFSVGSAVSIDKQLNRGARGPRPPNTLYVSELDPGCYRKVWYRYNLPPAEQQKYSKVAPNTLIKFMHGDIIEQLALVLVKATGRTVSHEQQPVSFTSPSGWELRGKMDAVIDGKHLIDVKSTTSFGYKEFMAGKGGDKFGYGTQLNTYKYLYNLAAPKKESLTTMGFLAVDRTLGHTGYGSCVLWGNPPVDFEYKFSMAVLAASAPIPDSMDRLASVSDGTSNMKLCTICSYCEYKHECWKDANEGEGIKSYLYAGGKVVHLVKVVKEPRVPELHLAEDTPDE